MPEKLLIGINGTVENFPVDFTPIVAVIPDSAGPEAAVAAGFLAGQKVSFNLPIHIFGWKINIPVNGVITAVVLPDTTAGGTVAETAPSEPTTPPAP